MMEYSPLAWFFCPLSYLGLLDQVQARAQGLAQLKASEDATQYLQPFQQRHDVAGMCIMHKVHRLQLPQLAELSFNPVALPSHSTHAVYNADHQRTVPYAKTEHYFHFFTLHYCQLWNTLVCQTNLHLNTSLKVFKSSINVWQLQVSCKSFFFPIYLIICNALLCFVLFCLVHIV